MGIERLKLGGWRPGCFRSLLLVTKALVPDLEPTKIDASNSPVTFCYLGLYANFTNTS
jgi:hypothetical protein